MKNCTAIAIDATAYVDGRAPGFNYYIKALLDGLNLNLAANETITVFIRKNQAVSFSSYENRMNIKHVSIRNVFERMLWQNLVFCFIAKKFDSVLYPGNFAPFFSKRNYLLVIHDLNYLKYPKNFSKLSYWFRCLLSKRSIVNAQNCVAISEHVQNEIKDNYSCNSTVIHNAVKKPVHTVQVGDDYKKITSTKYLIVVPSSLAVHKNVEAAYTAALEIVEKNADAQFVFFGSWKVEDFPNIKTHQRVSLLGYVSDNEKARLLSACDAILVPSVYEGFGIPYVEALLLGKALICSRIPVAKEIAGNYPYYINAPFGVAEIVSSYDHARDECFTSTLQDNSFLKKYSVEYVASKYLELLRT
jgi:glycosyltransferase involved in cell wall biosynthesis